MKLGTRVSVTFNGHVSRVGSDFIDVVDEDIGVVHRVSTYGDAETQPFEVVLPRNWPPVAGDVWKHLGVTFLAEGSGDHVWFISSDGGSEDPNETVRVRPGIKLVNRAPKSIYSEEGYENKPVGYANDLPG